MGCETGIAKVIASTCATAGIGGIEVKVRILNRTDIESVTYDGTYPSKVTAMTMKSTKRAWTLTGFKKNLVAGDDLVVSETMPDKYSHYFNFKQFETLAADIENIVALNDVVVIYESKDKTTTGDGVFRILGLQNGLYKSTATMRTNADNGTRNIELTSLEGEAEEYPYYTFHDTSYATTLAAIEALETPAV